MKKHTLNLHIRTLNEVNNTFKDLKTMSSKDDVYTSVKNIKSLTKLIKETEASYKAYIQACYMSADSLLLYNLFLENIMVSILLLFIIIVVVVILVVVVVVIPLKPITNSLYYILLFIIFNRLIIMLL